MFPAGRQQRFAMCSLAFRSICISRQSKPTLLFRTQLRLASSDENGRLRYNCRSTKFDFRKPDR